MTMDLLTNIKCLNDIVGIFVDPQNEINIIWRLTLRNALTESLELKFLCENIAFVLNNKYNITIFAKLLIGHNYSHLKSGAFSLDMSIFQLPSYTRDDRCAYS